MINDDPYLFVSYSSADRDRVLPFVEMLNREGVKTWLDRLDLLPGSSWAEAIVGALEQAAGIIVFISTKSAVSPSVNREVLFFDSKYPERAIIPIYLERRGVKSQTLDYSLSSRPTIDLTDTENETLHRAVRQVVAISKALKRPAPSLESPSAAQREVAEEVAAGLRNEQQPPSSSEPPRSVLIVHGHDESLLQETETFLTTVGVEPLVLRRIKGATQSLFQKFMQHGVQARFAIVLLTADDYGASRRQYDTSGIGDRSLQFRARQNVILELGFFYGRLGWENVFVLQKEANKIFPNFELPSDLGGVVFDEVDATGEWKELLRKRLADAGFVLRALQ